MAVRSARLITRDRCNRLRVFNTLSHIPRSLICCLFDFLQSSRRGLSIGQKCCSFFLLFLFVGFIGFAEARADKVHAFETPPVFHAEEVLPASLLRGSHHWIQDPVYNDGINNRYTVNSRYGSLTVEGTDLLMIRLKEINAIRLMEELKRTDIYLDGLKNAAVAPLELGKDFLTSPIDTVSGVATGVGKWFGNMGHSLWGGPSEREEGFVKTLIGFDSLKRKFAYEFGVDHYSRYEQLQEQLNEISWTAFAGSITVRAAFLAIPSAAGMAVRGTGFSNGMNKLIRDKTPAELKEFNAGKLNAMGVHASVAEIFLEHPKYSPTQKTFLVGALERMDGVAQREIFIQVASLVQEESVAFFRRRQAEMLASYHVNVSPLMQCIRLANGSFVQRKDGTIVGVFPIDHLAWTENVSRVENMISRSIQATFKDAKKELWIAGTVSTQARQHLEASGWVVHDKAAPRLSLK